jgi:hypothetical protein
MPLRRLTMMVLVLRGLADNDATSDGDATQDSNSGAAGDANDDAGTADNDLNGSAARLATLETGTLVRRCQMVTLMLMQLLRPIASLVQVLPVH